MTTASYHAAPPLSIANFRRDARGFRCAADYDRDQLVFFSVPNDAGWTARLDGAETEIIDSCGMMAIRVPAGAHEIAFEYHTPGARTGLLISLAGWLLFCATAVRKRLKRRGGAQA